MFLAVNDSRDGCDRVFLLDSCAHMRVCACVKLKDSAVCVKIKFAITF
jgi:hypothetical protein